LKGDGKAFEIGGEDKQTGVGKHLAQLGAFDEAGHDDSWITGSLLFQVSAVVIFMIGGTGNDMLPTKKLAGKRLLIKGD
jgi:hypothetical protein